MSLKPIKIALVTIFALSSCMALGLPAQAAQKNILTDACGTAAGAARGSAVCQAENSGDPITGPNGVLSKVTRLVSYLAGVTAIILLIVGGMMYVLSNGDAGKLQTAKNTIIYAVVGLAVVIFAQAILIFVLNKV
jgi:hypothetical protein